MSAVAQRRTTHTLAVLEVSESTYREISEALKAAGYDHAFLEGGMIDMTGIGLDEKVEQ